MKHINILLMILSMHNYANAQIKKQPNIQFQTDFIHAVNHWVVFFQKPSDPYLLGYIYLDLNAGFTFAAFSKISFDRDGNFKIEKLPPIYVTRKLLDANTNPVSLLTNEMISELKLPSKPEWLKVFENEEENIANLIIKAGFYSNAGFPAGAIPLLVKAYEKEPLSKDVIIRLACTYNSAAEYDNAISFCRKIRQRGIRDYMVQRELGFALIQKGDYEEAEIEYESTIPLCENDLQKREMCLDMAQTFLKNGDQIKLEKWTAWTRKYASGDAIVLKYIDLFESEIRKM